MLPLLPPGAPMPPGISAGPAQGASCANCGSPTMGQAACPGCGAPVGAGMGAPPLPPAAQAAGMASALVPGQVAEQAQLTQEQTANTLAALLHGLASAPNPAAEAAQGQPSPLVAPKGQAPEGASMSDPYGGA